MPLRLSWKATKKNKRNAPLISIHKLTPIQMPHVDLDDLKEGRKAFTKEEWLDIMLRSTGMEPDEFTYREKWLLITRMLPLVENNFNFCELGRVVLVSLISIKRFLQTVSWYPVDRQLLQICSITWAERLLDLSDCGTVLRLMKLRASISRIKMAFRL